MDQEDDSFKLDSDDEARVQQELDDNDSIGGEFHSNSISPAVIRTNARSFEPEFETKLLQLVEDAGSFEGLEESGDRQAVDKLLNSDQKSYGSRGDPLRKQVRNRLQYLRSLQKDAYYRLLVAYKITPFALRGDRAKKQVPLPQKKGRSTRRSIPTPPPPPLTTTPPRFDVSPQRAQQLFAEITPTPKTMSGVDSKGKTTSLLLLLELSTCFTLLVYVLTIWFFLRCCFGRCRLPTKCSPSWLYYFKVSQCLSWFDNY